MSMLNTVIKTLVVGTVTATAVTAVYVVTKEILDEDDGCESKTYDLIENALDMFTDD